MNNPSHTALVIEYISLGVGEIKDGEKIENSERRRHEIRKELNLSHEEIIDEAKKVIT